MHMAWPELRRPQFKNMMFFPWLTIMPPCMDPDIWKNKVGHHPWAMRGPRWMPQLLREELGGSEMQMRGNEAPAAPAGSADWGPHLQDYTATHCALLWSTAAALPGHKGNLESATTTPVSRTPSMEVRLGQKHQGNGKLAQNFVKIETQRNSQVSMKVIKD